MTRSRWIRRSLGLLIVCAVVAPVRAQMQSETYTNLKVLPKDITSDQLDEVMRGFTRGLGVRCNFCHVSHEGQPMRHEDFALDDKPTKRKARQMMLMVKDINEKYLANLDARANPPVSVKCVTCHHGSTLPRQLQDVLKQSYDDGGMDSTVARYHTLRDRFYGRALYDFGEVPLADVANDVGNAGHTADAVRLHALNVEMNPTSMFAKRQHASGAILLAYEQSGADSGAAAYRAFKDRYGAPVVSEELMNGIGYDLLRDQKPELGIAALKLNADEHPTGNAFDSLGEAYLQHGDWKLATAAYTKSLQLAPDNDNAKKKLDEIKTQSKGRPKSKKK